MSDFELGVITGAALMFGALSGRLARVRARAVVVPGRGHRRRHDTPFCHRRLVRQ